MASIREIRKQVSSITSTRKITSAMQMVAASKMRRAQERMRAARPYSEQILALAQRVASASGQYRPALMRRREPQRVAYILISTDKGLCGGLNQNLFRVFIRHLGDSMEGADAKPEAVQVGALGTKGAALARRLKLACTDAGKLGDRPPPEKILAVVQPLLEDFAEERLDRIYLATSRFVSTMSQTPVILQLAPVEPLPEYQDSGDYIYEPSAEELLDGLLRRYAEAVVYEAVIENNACEQAAKMVAMKSATENAEQLMEELQLAYNNARQASITAELADIIGGAEAV